MSRFGDQFAARLGRGITRAWPDGASGWAQKVDKPLRRSHFARAADAARQPSISPFASPGGFVIRSGVADPVRMFLGSSAVEHSTVNRMVAGSNPARGASCHITWHPPFPFCPTASIRSHCAAEAFCTLLEPMRYTEVRHNTPHHAGFGGILGLSAAGR